MTKQEQIEEMAVIGCVRNPQAHTAEECAKCDFKQGQCNAYRHAEALYSIGYRKVPDGAVVFTPDYLIAKIGNLDELKEKIGSLTSEKEGWKRRYIDSGQRNKRLSIKNAQLKAENEELKAKLEKNPLAIKQKIMEEDDYELTEREQATLFLDRMESDLELLHDMVENLDELLGKGIDEYIMGRDGVEGLKDMWERSAVRAFADKLKTRLETKDQHYICMYDWNAHSAVTDCENEVDELLKEYEQ